MIWVDFRDRRASSNSAICCKKRVQHCFTNPRRITSRTHWRFLAKTKRKEQVLDGTQHLTPPRVPSCRPLPSKHRQKLWNAPSPFPRRIVSLEPLNWTSLNGFTEWREIFSQQDVSQKATSESMWNHGRAEGKNTLELDVNVTQHKDTLSRRQEFLRLLFPTRLNKNVEENDDWKVWRLQAGHGEIGKCNTCVPQRQRICNTWRSRRRSWTKRSRSGRATSPTHLFPRKATSVPHDVADDETSEEEKRASGRDKANWPGTLRTKMGSAVAQMHGITCLVNGQCELWYNGEGSEEQDRGCRRSSMNKTQLWPNVKPETWWLE